MSQTSDTLNEAERVFLFEASKTDYFKIFKKALHFMYLAECAALATAKPEELLKHQGILVGLAQAQQLVLLGRMPDSDQKKDIQRHPRGKKE